MLNKWRNQKAWMTSDPLTFITTVRKMMIAIKSNEQQTTTNKMKQMIKTTHIFTI